MEHLRVRIFALIAICMLALLYGSGLRNEIGPYGDDADYVILSEAILQGEYRPIHLAENPPTTHRPPLFSLLLTPLVAVWGRDYLLLKMPIFLSGVASTALFFIWLRSMKKTPIGDLSLCCIAVLPFAFSPLTIEFSSAIMSEMPFTVFLLITLLAIQRWRNEDGKAKRVWFWCAIGFCTAMILMRTIGLVVTGALGLGLMAEGLRLRFISEPEDADGAHLHSQIPRFVFGGSLLTLAFVLFVAWRWSMSLGGEDYLDQLARTDLHGTVQSRLGLYEVLQRVVQNSQFYLSQILYWTLGLPRRPSLWWLGLIVFGIAVLGAIRSWRRGMIAEPFAFFAGLAVLAVWVTRSGRFMLPLLPLLIWLVWIGGSFLLQRLCIGIIRRRIVIVLCLLIAVGATTGAIRQLRQPDPLAIPYWRDYRAAANWAYGHIPRASVVACRKPALFYLWSGRRVCWHPFVEDADQALDRLERLGATHLVRDEFPFTHTTRTFVDPLLESRPERFVVLMAAEDTRLYAIVSASER